MSDMKKANIVKITNNSNKDIVIWHKEIVLQNKWGILIKKGSWVLIECRYIDVNYFVGLYECFFQFVGRKRKIKVDNIKKHGIDLEYTSKEES